VVIVILVARAAGNADADADARADTVRKNALQQKDAEDMEQKHAEGAEDDNFIN
tara:strand:- start:60 stop:221 length:162 start_codon:yes stop_codon:yes gene_type:complete